MSERTQGQAFEVNYVVPPGRTLSDTIDEIGMSQAELARRTGLSPKTINQIVKGDAPITPSTALALEKVTGVPARFWNSLEVNHQAATSRASERAILAQETDLLDDLPIRELVNRGAIQGSDDSTELLIQVLSFFGVADRASCERVWMTPAAAFRQSEKLRANPGAVASWLRIGDLAAAQIPCAEFSKTRFREALSEIRQMTAAPVTVYGPAMVDLTADSGVALVFVPEISGARAWGASRWVSPTKAVLQLSLRYKWEDHFWFSFYHEAAHILLHGKRMTFVDSDGGDSTMEAEANRFAARMLIPREYEVDLPNLKTLAHIRTFAEEIDLHPGIVVGRLQRERVIGWGVGNGLRRTLVFEDS